MATLDAEEALFDSVEEALGEIKAGRAVIVTDDEDRENEGDLIFAAELATPEIVNLLIQHGRGLMCVPCEADHLRRLGIGQMVQENREAHRTDFTVSVDAAEGITTGISAQDRCATIQLLANPGTKPEQFVQPGHIFPLKAKDGGVLERAGHTEAAVDLARLAGMFHCAVLCEILNDDGTMARVPQLYEFKKRHGLKMISIAALIEYRRRRENLVELISQQPFESDWGLFTLNVFRSALDGRQHLAFVAGELDASPTLVRVHGENLFADVFSKQGDGKGGSLSSAFEAISKEGTGVVLYLQRHDGGLSQLKGSAGSGMGLREYGIGAQILVALGLSKIQLLSNSDRTLVGLEGYDLEIVERRLF